MYDVRKVFKFTLKMLKLKGNIGTEILSHLAQIF